MNKEHFSLKKVDCIMMLTFLFFIGSNHEINIMERESTVNHKFVCAFYFTKFANVANPQH